MVGYLVSRCLVGVTPRRTGNTNRDGRGIGQGHGARPHLPHLLRRLATVGDWLRDSPQLVSVLTETAYKIGGRGCL